MNTLDKDIAQLLEFDTSIVHENANKDSRTFNTFRDLTAGVVAKSFALERMLPEHVAKTHASNRWSATTPRSFIRAALSVSGLNPVKM